MKDVNDKEYVEEVRAKVNAWYDKYLADLNPDTDRRFDISYFLQHILFAKDMDLDENVFIHIRERYKKYLDHWSLLNRGKEFKSKKDSIADFLGSGKVNVEFGAQQDFRWKFFFGDRTPEQIRKLHNKWKSNL